jgi:phosphoribosylaminoimidazolecarboxamide formyltransferase / IMP cyclohydrolase
MDSPRERCRRALVSVTNKEGLVDFVRALIDLGVEVISTGGTARSLDAAGLSVVHLEDFTGWPEMLDGRVKTLHPKVHAGLLAVRSDEAHVQEMREHALSYIDLVAVNLYDFHGALAEPGRSFDNMLESIDIGGPTLLRGAAKNHQHVVPLVDPSDYGWVLARLQKSEVITPSERRALAAKVFATISAYDRAIAGFLAGDEMVPSNLSGFPSVLNLNFPKRAELRYGENPHQNAALYVDSTSPKGLVAAEFVQGKELSYNNMLDADSALRLAIELGDGCAVYVKHNNPCGAARHELLHEAIRMARAVDSVSAFGAVVAVNAPVDEAAARVLVETFLEVIIAPELTDGARRVLAEKKNLRVLRLPSAEAWRGVGLEWELRQVFGGLLVQDADRPGEAYQEVKNARVVTKRAPTDEEWKALTFGWLTAKHVRSNAIVFAQADRLLAVGAGQMSRIDSVKICREKAQDSLRGSAVASDAFFPFRDGVDALAAAGATAIVQPGGSIRDEEVIHAADEHGLAMVFTGVRHFRH